MPKILSAKRTQQILELLSPKRPAPLNLQSGLGSIAETLRGGNQPAQQLLQQLSARPGVKPADVQRMLGHIDSAQMLAPKALAANVRSPKLFAQRGLGKDTMSDTQAQMDRASDLMYGPELATPRRQFLLDAARNIDSEFETGTTATRASTEKLKALFTRLDSNAWGAGRADAGDSQTWLASRSRYADQLESGLISMLEARYPSFDWGDVLMDSHVLDDAMAMAARTGTPGRSFGPLYQEYQRQVWPGGKSADNYFETILRRNAQATDPTNSGRPGNVTNAAEHFGNRQQLGHIRGSVDPKAMRMQLDEVQSDPLSALKPSQMPELQDVHGKLGRMAIERAAAAGLEGVDIPNAARIGSVRNRRQLPFYESIYDKELGKTLYEPLQARGVPISYSDGINSIDLPEQLREAILAPGSKVLDYRRGGLARMKDVRRGTR